MLTSISLSSRNCWSCGAASAPRRSALMACNCCSSGGDSSGFRRIWRMIRGPDLALAEQQELLVVRRGQRSPQQRPDGIHQRRRAMRRLQENHRGVCRPDCGRHRRKHRHRHRQLFKADFTDGHAVLQLRTVAVISSLSQQGLRTWMRLGISLPWKTLDFGCPAVCSRQQLSNTASPHIVCLRQQKVTRKRCTRLRCPTKGRTLVGAAGVGVHIEQVLAVQGPGALPDAAHPL